MAEAPRSWSSTLYAVIFHPAEPRILLLPGAAGWSLPHVRLDEHVWPPSIVNQFREALRHEYGLEATVLRCAQVHDDEAAQDVQAIFTLDNHHPAWMPPDGAQWIDRQALADLPLAVPQQRAVLDVCLLEAESTSPPELRPPWARSGWFREATAWIEAQLAHKEYILLAPIEQIKTWGISAVLRARTTAGDLYFKQAARLPLFADEPVLTAALATMYPEHVPVPLAIDAARGWMLLPDVGSPLRHEQDTLVREATISLWGQMQRASVARVDALFAAGCLDRRLDVLATQIEPLLGDRVALALLDAEEIARLRALAPRLKALCGKLASGSVPPALVHGDLHWGNIAGKEGRTIIFDWTDACIAHPFFDLVTLLGIEDTPEDDPGERVRLRDSYLQLWSEYAPMEELRVIADLAEVLGALHQAVSYQYIVAGLEATSKHELASGFPYWARNVLKAMERGAV